MAAMPCSLTAQPETFELHTDKPFYITGQSIWYTINNTNYQALSEHSEVVYLNIHDSEGKLITQQIHRLVDGKADGMLPVSHRWEEDYYYITCFTRWNLQFDADKFFCKKIAIYNASETPTGYDTPNRKASIVSPPSTIISTNKPVYSRRELVTLRFNDLPEGEYSISVIPYVQYFAGLQLADSMLYPVSVRYIKKPEVIRESAIMLHGSVMDETTRQPVNSDLLLLYKKGSNEFRRVNASNGMVNSQLGWLEGSAEYQLSNMNPFETITPVIEIHIPGGELLIEEEIYEKPPRTAAVDQCIRNEKLRAKVEEMFYENSPENHVSGEFIPIPFKSDKVYLMEKYKGMKNLGEFFQEIVYQAEVTTKNDQTAIRLKNTETQKFFMESPWFLVDGQLTRDVQTVFAIPFKNLVRIELFNTNKSILSQLDALMVRSGLIAVYTDGNVPAAQYPVFQKTIKVDGLSISPDFETAPITKPASPHENPVLRSTIYWNPDVTVNPGSELQFPTTDDMGNFIIRVAGLTSENRYIESIVKYKVAY